MGSRVSVASQSYVSPPLASMASAMLRVNALVCEVVRVLPDNKRTNGRWSGTLTVSFTYSPWK